MFILKVLYQNFIFGALYLVFTKNQLLNQVGDSKIANGKRNVCLLLVTIYY